MVEVPRILRTGPQEHVMRRVTEYRELQPELSIQGHVSNVHETDWRRILGFIIPYPDLGKAVPGQQPAEKLGETTSVGAKYAVRNPAAARSVTVAASRD